MHEVAERSVLALKSPGDERREAASIFLNFAHDPQMIHALLQRLAAAEHHGGGSAHAQRVRGAVHVDPFRSVALKPADAVPDPIVQNLRAAAGDGVEARVAQPGDGVAQAQAADFGDVGNLRRGEAMQVYREALLDGAQQIFVPLDLQVGMQAALHQDAGAPQVQRFLDLGEDGLVVVDVPFGVAHGPVEGAKTAIFRTKIRVINVAVDDIRNHTFGMILLAEGVGRHTDTDQIVGTEKVEGFGVRDHFEIIARKWVRRS
jgi:hypothetical protein